MATEMTTAQSLGRLFRELKAEGMSEELASDVLMRYVTATAEDGFTVKPLGAPVPVQLQVDGGEFAAFLSQAPNLH